jgi:hypothetical protein
MNFQIRFEGNPPERTLSSSKGGDCKTYLYFALQLFECSFMVLWEKKSHGSQNLNVRFGRSMAGKPHLLEGWQSLQIHAESNHENHGGRIAR